MPEGDALRRTAAALDRTLAGRVLVRAELRWPTAAGADLVGRVVRHTRPYGKHLLTRFDDGRTLHTHLRMEGRWRLVATGTPGSAARSARVRAVLANTSTTAIGIDLGMLDLVATVDEHTLLAHLGPDLLDEGFDTGTGAAPGPGLTEAIERWRRHGREPVCDVLLDQSVVAGIGTIYLAESLFAERAYPWAAADEVDPVRVLRTARVLMQRAVASGRAPGRVHGRRGHPCPRCGTPIARGTALPAPHARPVFWCPTCQAPISRPV